MTERIQPHPGEQHDPEFGARLNWLRAGVLGANDGIVSVAGLVMGIAGATQDRSALVIAGAAGLISGALSMAGGEYVSVSTQRDSERAMIRKERGELSTMPDDELVELTGLYQAKGISPELARRVAEELTAKDALRAHLDAELHIDPDDLANPWQAAGASFVAFSVGALLPVLAILLPPSSYRVPVCVVAVALALVLTGAVSARLGGAPAMPAVIRNAGIGLIAMAITFAVGTVIGPGV